MARDMSVFACTKEAFRPCRSDAVRWWGADEWEEAYKANEGMWPDSTPWSKEEWQQLCSQGYRYCAVLKNGRAVASAGLWPRARGEWEVIAVGTAPGFRRHGYGKAVVSFVTEAILSAGRLATIGFREENVPMHRIALALGYERR